MIAAWAIAAYAAELPAGSAALLRVGFGCVGCDTELAAALARDPHVASVRVAPTDGWACVTLRSSTTTEALTAAARDCDDLVVRSVEPMASCPAVPPPLPPTDPWANPPPGADIQIVSRGEVFDPKAAKVDGKTTVFDYGAPWCGPCHLAARLLGAYAATHPAVAIRAIHLGGTSPAESFALPVARAHLSDVPGVPWLVVYGPTGKVRYRGADAAAALAAIEAP
jgi:thiol-disulfide isomerase/thioredoxin